MSHNDAYQYLSATEQESQGFMPFGVSLPEVKTITEAGLLRLRRTVKVGHLLSKATRIIDKAQQLDGSGAPYITLTRVEGFTLVDGCIYDRGIGRATLSRTLAVDDSGLVDYVHFGLQRLGEEERLFDSDGVGDLVFSELHVGLNSLNRHVDLAISNRRAVGGLGPQE